MRMVAKPGEDLRDVLRIHRCTAETPWNPGIKCRGVQHVDAKEVGDQKDGYPGGDIVRMACPHCGHTWKTELPQ